MSKNFLVFQHTPWEGPGEFLLSAAARHRIRLQVIKVWEESIPETASHDGLIILGGGPNVDQEKQYPFLKKEKKAIRLAIDADIPCLGICLGHQLLAHVMGARVGPNFQPSVGFIAGYLTHAGREHPVLAGLPKKLQLFKWHGQAVLEPLPKDLTMLATSADCQVEAFGVKGRPHIIGVQFDNHAAAPRDVETWLVKDAKWLSSLAGISVAPSAIASEAGRLREQLEVEFNRFIGNFFSCA